jgi:DNA-binding NarL/FixJ family response regulator
MVIADDNPSCVPVAVICVPGRAMAGARKTILCIENEQETAALLAGVLVKHGFQVQIAQDGQEGLLAILKKKPDLILCDIDAPILSGLDVLERLQDIAPSFGHVPFILLARAPNRDSEIRARRLGADDYVIKPVDIDRLLLIINARLVGIARTARPAKGKILNAREIEVLTWVAQGKTSAQIARKLRLSKRTVDFHIDNARKKLGAATRTEAVIKAAARGVIES